MLVVDLILKDNRGTLLNCVVFSNNEEGQEPIQDDITIVELLNGRITDGRGFICFQNRYINASTHYTHIKSFNIKKINENEF